MTDLFNILDGIIGSDYAADTLTDLDAIQTYAEAAGETITAEQAGRIAEAGRQWLEQQENGNGEWSRMREEARQALEA